jgi:signal peptidase I
VIRPGRRPRGLPPEVEQAGKPGSAAAAGEEAAGGQADGKPGKRPLGKRIAGWLMTALVVLVFAIVLVIMVIPAVMGLQRYVITGGSMTGTIPKGAVIYSELIPTSELKAGDVITFVPPGQTGAVTHRILSIKQGENGKLVYETKGDFNDFVDPWDMNLEDPRAARYSYHIPTVGYALMLLSIKQVRMLVIGLPAIVIAVSMLVSLWRAAGPQAQALAPAAAIAEAAADPIDHDARGRP